MPIRKEKRFCTIYTRTESERKAATLSKELDSTKHELEKASKELEDTRKALADLSKEVAVIKNLVSIDNSDNVELGNSAKKRTKKS